MRTFTNRLHSEEVVTDPDGASFMVRVGRTGVHRYHPMFGTFNVVSVIVTEARYLWRHDRRWTVSVWPKNTFAKPEVILSENFPSRPRAALRANEITEAIVNGTFAEDRGTAQ